MSARLRKALQELAGQRWGSEKEFEELAGFALGTNEGTRHRALAVVGGAMVEEALRAAISMHLYAARSEECDRLLFEEERGPLASLASRTRMAHALGVIDDDLRSDLTFIRGIRNAFAHSPERVSFAHKTILASIDALKVINPLVGEDELRRISEGHFDAMRFAVAVAVICGGLRLRRPYWYGAWNKELGRVLQESLRRTPIQPNPQDPENQTEQK